MNSTTLLILVVVSCGVFLSLAAAAILIFKGKKSSVSNSSSDISTVSSSTNGIVSGPVPSSSKDTCPSGWSEAAGTVYDSWPKPKSKECVGYSGCKWAGMFSKVDAGPENAKGPCKSGAKVLDGGNGVKWCRWPEEKVKSWSMASTWEKDDALLGKTVDVMVKGGNKFVRVNVGDVCADSDCGGCCSKNAGGKKLIDIEKWPAGVLLGFTHDSPKFDVNEEPKASGVKKMCYKVVGNAPPFK